MAAQFLVYNHLLGKRMNLFVKQHRFKTTKYSTNSYSHLSSTNILYLRQICLNFSNTKTCGFSLLHITLNENTFVFFGERSGIINNCEASLCALLVFYVIFCTLKR